MGQKRPLTEKEIKYAIQHLSVFSDDEDVESFSSESSDNYEPESKADNSITRLVMLKKTKRTNLQQTKLIPGK